MLKRNTVYVELLATSIVTYIYKANINRDKKYGRNINMSNNSL